MRPRGTAGSGAPRTALERALTAPRETRETPWTNPRLAMGFGKEGEFDFGGCVVGAYLYESYNIKAPRVLKKRDGKYWTLYGCYALRETATPPARAAHDRPQV